MNAFYLTINLATRESRQVAATLAQIDAALNAIDQSARAFFRSDWRRTPGRFRSFVADLEPRLSNASLLCHVADTRCRSLATMLGGSLHREVSLNAGAAWTPADADALLDSSRFTLRTLVQVQRMLEASRQFIGETIELLQEAELQMDLEPPLQHFVQDLLRRLSRQHPLTDRN